MGICAIPSDLRVAAGSPGWYNRGYTMDMKTAVSLPDPIFRSAERLAEKLGVSRSELYCRALRELLDRNDDDTVRKRLDEVYGKGHEDPGLEPELAAMQARSVKGRDAW